jgi:hypothetical protein
MDNNYFKISQLRAGLPTSIEKLVGNPFNVTGYKIKGLL